jgi:tRNA C32,U32 (ribose-2'-O)-methylase TrmJ
LDFTNVEKLRTSKKIAIVMGSECDGVSKDMSNAADRSVFLPLFGFTESLNVGVACALVVQRLLDMYPERRGDLSLEQATELKTKWGEPSKQRRIQESGGDRIISGSMDTKHLPF